MILKNVSIVKELYLTAKRELIEEKRSETFETLFAEEYRKAKELGALQGEKRGYQRAQEELGSLLLLVQRLSEKLLEQKKQLLEQMKPQMGELVLLIAEKVIRTQLQNREQLTHHIEQLIELAQQAFPDEKLKVFTAPCDQSQLQVEGITFLPDPTLNPGDCRIEARSGMVQAAVKRLLEELC